jgi:formiminotetrahydrofolate cyclodeaminase
MPVFEGLLALPRSNEIVLNLLFVMATWHTYAKLRLHTTASLEAFKSTRKELGKALRLFNSQVCNLHTTRELPRETAARERREARALQKAIEEGRSAPEKSATSGQKAMAFSMTTFKLHGTAHLPEDVALYGTSDNYSTQTVCSHPSLSVSHSS